MSCPNCGQTHRGVSACALGVILGVIEDRGELALDTITPEIVAEIDVNEFWDRVGALRPSGSKNSYSRSAHKEVAARMSRAEKRAEALRELAKEFDITPGDHSTTAGRIWPNT